MRTPVALLTDPNQNVVLTGFMGTGKSTTGRRLAARLGFDFVDTDELIRSEHGSIADLFATHGEARFRELERETAVRLAETRRHVIATGGATLLDRGNERLLGGSGRVFCLAASPARILDRVLNSKSDIERPLLHDADPAARVQQLLTERTPSYRRFPQVSTDGGDSGAIASDLELLTRTHPTVHDDGVRPFVVGIGIAARATSVFAEVDATVVDVGRIQPARPLDALSLVSIQQHLASFVLPT